MRSLESSFKRRISARLAARGIEARHASTIGFPGTRVCRRRPGNRVSGMARPL